MRLFAILTAMAALAAVGSAPLFVQAFSSLPVHARLPLPALVAVQSAQVLALASLAAFAGNAPAGVLFGWLFRRRGLESAMLAHGAADVWLHGVLPALLA